MARPEEDTTSGMARYYLAYVAVCIVSLVLLVEGVAGLVVVAFLAAWWSFLSRTTEGRVGSPASIAITLTAAAVLLTVAGGVGYPVGHTRPLVDSHAWSGSVIWWQLGLGLALLPAIVFFWRLGLRTPAG